MTSLLTHPVVHSTRPSYRPKINNQPLKKFLSLAVSWVKVEDPSAFKNMTKKFNFAILTTFTQLTTRLKNFLRGWLLILGLKEGLVECATVCVKSEVILILKARKARKSWNIYHFWTNIPQNDQCALSEISGMYNWSHIVLTLLQTISHLIFSNLFL